MAYIEELLKQRLTGDSGVAALAGDRVYPDMLPQTVTYPAVRYKLVSRLEKLVKPQTTGPGAELNIVRSRYQLDVYAKTYAGAKALGTAITQAVRGWKDPDQGVIVARVDDVTDMTDGEKDTHRLSIDVVITYNE